MKKWEQLLLTLNNSKLEKEQGDYQDKTQKLFQTMRVRIMRYEFLKVLPWQGEFDLWDVFNEVRFMELDLLSFQNIESQMCL